MFETTPARFPGAGVFMSGWCAMRMLKPALRTMDTRTCKPTPKTVDAELGTRDWKSMRERVIREAGGKCEHPGCGRAEPRMYADHIVERRDGGAVFDRANLQCLCAKHHTLKTNAERAKRMRG